METKPTSLKVGAFSAALGGVAMIIAMAMTIDLSTDDAIGKVCYFLLTAIVFFAIAGGFKKNGQWPVELMIIMAFVAIALVIVGAIFNVYSVWNMIAPLVLAILALVTVLGCLSSSVWFGSIDA